MILTVILVFYFQALIYGAVFDLEKMRLFTGTVTKSKLEVQTHLKVKPLMGEYIGLNRRYTIRVKLLPDHPNRHL
jgi:hypothetical protein